MVSIKNEEDQQDFKLASGTEVSVSTWIVLSKPYGSSLNKCKSMWNWFSNFFL